MSALLIVRDHDDAGGAERLRVQGLDSLARQGFPSPQTRRFPTGSVYWCATPGNPASRELLQDIGEADEFVACVGTLFYRGRTGGEGLRQLWRDFASPDRFDWQELWGNYLLVILKTERLWVFGDPVGMIRLYRTGDHRVWSSSWLACADCAASRELDRIGTIDYVMSGANHGERTPLRAVRIADPVCAFELTRGESRPLSTPARWTDGSRYASMSDAVDAAAGLLTDRATDIARGFDGRVRAALSGGFDSRLIVAALRSAGVAPRLHVYGAPGDEDVRIATAAADAVGLALDHIDKSELNRTLPVPDDQEIRRQCGFFDGLPIDGVFDRGADRLTRIRQSADGSLALNGGGGEILRNFFYLHDRPLSAAQIVQTFYSNWIAAAIPARADRDDYFDYMVDAIERAVGATGRMPRARVELVYPLFRVRYWTARNNSIAARSGHFLTPLVDPELVRLSYVLPLHWKDYGRFEAALLTRLDGALAGIELAYGFTPLAGPDWRYRAKMWFQQRRPPWLRARSARLRAWLAKGSPGAARAAPGAVDPGVDDALGIVRASRLSDSDQLQRLRTLETIC